MYATAWRTPAASGGATGHVSEIVRTYVTHLHMMRRFANR